MLLETIRHDANAVCLCLTAAIGLAAAGLGYAHEAADYSAGEPGNPDTVKLLPERLRALIERSKRLNDHVRRLDANIYAPPLAPDRSRTGNPVERQLGLLKAAFERHGR